ncbi:nucleotidyl transferase AbiEii/AbiGii toxin family protein [Enorma burkinafasonensis]|uniref:nucleotidyl transferase AbiEii/AbiGii toxin family protein n=1 Tax=Enorma burkinafasonensis TaxID=2590867 RepID=UPI0026EBDCE8|nr:nucleotidyl transferase AbiEii/AbiGii toxin family protein [Enorma burkinafasonensis]MCI7729863.1 nucleotidyl transferase AbiEii/AbiGii toxin family protein [Enorma burkinafasonensis]
MRTKNAMQLKARIRNKAKEAGIPPQSLMQDYLFERLLVRLSTSNWRSNVVVKGGMLISSLVGVASRTTMDLDTTVCGFTLTHASVESVFREIAALPADDDWRFEFDRTEDIRETDDYPGIRVHLKAIYPPMEVPLTIDVTTGDSITPAPIEYDYPLLFDEGSVRLKAYPLETVLAEKLEAVISRGVASTRPRDFYDICTLWRLFGADCNVETLRRAVGATCDKRGSALRLSRWEQVLDEVENDGHMLAQWDKYRGRNPYAAGMSL